MAGAPSYHHLLTRIHTIDEQLYATAGPFTRPEACAGLWSDVVFTGGPLPTATVYGVSVRRLAVAEERPWTTIGATGGGGASPHHRTSDSVDTLSQGGTSQRADGPRFNSRPTHSFLRISPERTTDFQLTPTNHSYDNVRVLTAPTLHPSEVCPFISPHVTTPSPKYVTFTYRRSYDVTARNTNGVMAQGARG